VGCMDLDRINHFVLNKQHLAAASRGADLVRIVRDVGGLHATSSTTPYLSLLARVPKFEKTDLEEELYERRTLGKIRCVRKTIYIHAKDMIPVAFRATASVVVKASRRHMEYRGVSAEEYEAVSRAILDILAGREMTASAIKTALGTGVDLSSILYLMCDQGVLIRGRPERGWKDKNHRYSLFRAYFPDIDLDEMSEMEAITSLVEQYLASFGPVKESDIVWWTGLGKIKVRAAMTNLQHLVSKVTMSGVEGDFCMLRSDEALVKDVGPPDIPTVNLLPTLDPYLMGYKERGRYLDEGYYDKVFDRSGNATSTILVGGKVLGVWDFEGGEEPVVKLFLFEPMGRDALDKVHVEAQRLGRFIAGREVQIRECDAMVPLTERTAGSVMSPLRGC
jgi:hypothetical protein